jgi:protein ImuB
MQVNINQQDIKNSNMKENLSKNSPENLSENSTSASPVEANRRYLAVSLPRLATDRIMRKRKGLKWRQQKHFNAVHQQAAIIVVDQIKNAWRITHLDRAAEQMGLCHGQSLSDARAICPDVDVAYEDIQGDQLLLEAIADWCDRYTPLVSLDIPDGLILDITGCAHLFGGEEVLANDLLTRLFQQGFAASGAVATTPGAAWAASRFSTPLRSLEKREKSAPESEITSEITSEIAPQIAPQIAPVCVIQPGKEDEALAILPLAGLRLDSQTLGGLAKLGLRTIGQVMARPRAPLTRRFGKLLMLRMDQALGQVEEAISSRLPVPELMAERKLAEPIGRAEDIEILIERLARRLCDDMEKRGAGARNIDLALFRMDGKVVRLGVGTSSPVRDPDSICRLFCERLAAIHDDFDAGLGFEIGRLSALEIEPCAFDQTSLLTPDNNCSDFTHLIDKLGARLGLSRIICMVPGETHLPEKVDIIAPVISRRGEIREISENFLHPVRPMRLLRNPEPVEAIASVPEGPPVRFRWRRKLHVVVHVEGPERISDEWWDDQWRSSDAPRDAHDAPSHIPGYTRSHIPGPGYTRDYFRIEDDQGYRYWLYRQGLYTSETNSPRWYMHGIFP